MKRFLLISHMIFLGIILLSALHYLDIGQAKTYVAWYAISEMLAVLVSIVLFAMKKTRLPTLRYVYVLLGIMQLFPMIGAFIISGKYTVYGILHLAIIMWCVICVMFLCKKVEDRV